MTRKELILSAIGNSIGLLIIIIMMFSISTGVGFIGSTVMGIIIWACGSILGLIVSNAIRGLVCMVNEIK